MVKCNEEDEMKNVDGRLNMNEMEDIVEIKEKNKKVNNNDNI